MLSKWLSRLSPTARALLAEERASTEDEDVKARALARAEAALEGERWSGVALRRAEEERALALRSSRRRGAVLAGAGAVVFAGLAVAGVRWAAVGTPDLESRAPATVVTPPPPPHGKVLVDPAPASRVEAAAAPTDPAPIASVAPAAPRARSSSAKEYAIELALLEPARSSIARGSYATALTAIAKHQHEYPSGQLAEEREALRVRALWGLGQEPAARAAAASFRKRYPRSVLLSWMKSAPAP